MSSSSALGLFGKKIESAVMKGEIRIIDKNGKILVFGNTKSKKVKDSTKRTLGDTEGRLSVEHKKDETEESRFYSDLVISHLKQLSNDF